MLLTTWLPETAGGTRHLDLLGFGDASEQRILGIFREVLVIAGDDGSLLISTRCRSDSSAKSWSMVECACAARPRSPSHALRSSDLTLPVSATPSFPRGCHPFIVDDPTQAGQQRHVRFQTRSQDGQGHVLSHAVRCLDLRLAKKDSDQGSRSNSCNNRLLRRARHFVKIISRRSDVQTTPCMSLGDTAFILPSREFDSAPSPSYDDLR